MKHAEALDALLERAISEIENNDNELVRTSSSESHECYMLPDSMRDRLANALEAFVSTRPTLNVDQDAFELLHCTGIICHRVLSPSVVRVMQRFGRRRSCKILSIDNLPQQPVLPPTPCKTGFLRSDSELLFSDALQFGFLSLMGLTPIAHAHENNKRLQRNVVPQEDSGNSRSSWGFDVPFEAHVDNLNASFIWEKEKLNWPCVPPVLAFLGLRNEDANGRPVPTSIIPLAEVIAELDDHTKEVLRRSDFLIAAPDSNDDSDCDAPQSIRSPILVRDDGGEDHIRFDPGVTQGLDEPAEAALDELKAVLRRGKGRIDLRVRGGSACYFWNSQVLHQRTAFDPGPSDVARWLRRCYATPDINASYIADRRRNPLVWCPKPDTTVPSRLPQLANNGSFAGMNGL